MFEFITDFLKEHGYLGLFALMVLENVFPPIPSEVIVPFAGFVAAHGELHLAGVLLAGTLGSVVGALPWYYAARAYGAKRLKRAAARHGRWLALTCGDVDKALHAFDRHGGKAVLFGRLVPALRTLVSLPAGIAAMKLPTFLLLSALGSLAWTALLAATGFVLKDQYEHVAEFVDPVSKAVLGLLLSWYLYRVATWKPGAGT
ncbi:DedA family protein [Massilia sp. YIM B02763]|uniref:DedA family protein n=1 Tax=Massilia sp. YIM B02763 TaxID=3050130 RepID=UPI0025B6AC1B|nr:DedA family protein [Massilia sp. YIM B02763]MDN4052459.1 DedA family protein [Massilia sp. YIM B02763]